MGHRVDATAIVIDRSVTDRRAVAVTAAVGDGRCGKPHRSVGRATGGTVPARSVPGPANHRSGPTSLPVWYDAPKPRKDEEATPIDAERLDKEGD